MNLILFDDPQIKKQLLPLTFLRPIARIRIGILTIAEKWEFYSSETASFAVESYLAEKYPVSEKEDNLLVNGAVCPTKDVWMAIQTLEIGEVLKKDGIVIAGRKKDSTVDFENAKSRDFNGELTILQHTWDIFAENGKQIITDFEMVTEGRESQKIKDPHTVVYGQENLFIEEGVEFKAAIINAEEGPIYIGKNARIMEGAIMRGPISIGEGTHVNMNAKVRSNTTLGPFCRAGGEINNVVMFGCSNKGHEGFLGNAVIAEWCNIGADANNSNLKNNYTEVKMWDYSKEKFVKTGRQFCGLIMGDHTKCGINTMFNTGTVIGIGANIFGSGFPRNFLPSFSWGGAAGLTSYRLDRFFEMANNMMKRRNIQLSEQDLAILSHIFEISSKNRNF